MQHTSVQTAPNEWRAFAQGVTAFEGDRADADFQAFATAARSRVADYALGVRLERSGQNDIRVVGFWEEPAFLRRVTVERDLGLIKAGLANEIRQELSADTPIEARVAALDFSETGEPVNLIIDLLAAA